MNRAIIIMTKVPAAGNVKTRLQPILSAAQCAELAECFLRDTVAKAHSTKIPVIIAFSPIEARQSLIEILPDEKFYVEQTGENLGEKMFNAFQFAFLNNLDSVVMIGTDSPTYPAEFISRAFEYLAKNDAVLGKTADGGFYLIGLRVLKKEIFEAVEWSSPQTFEQTARNIKKLDLKFALAPDWFDVDTANDLERLKIDVSENPNLAPRTFAFLRTI